MGAHMCVVACSLQELIALRKLQKSQLRQGIDVEKLNRGDLKKQPAAEVGEAQNSLQAMQNSRAQSDDETEGYGLQPKPGKSDDPAP